MKIISKFKDYYDFQQGTIGVDNKLVLDRTKFTTTPYGYNIVKDEVEKITFFICDYKVEGAYYKGEFLYGEDLGKIEGSYSGKYGVTYTDKWGHSRTINKHSQYLGKESPNRKHDCPILIQDWAGYSLHPILKDYNIQKVFNPFQIWILLSEWLAKEPEIVNNQTNEEKILSHGFDKKTSFRGK